MRSHPTCDDTSGTTLPVESTALAARGARRGASLPRFFSAPRFAHQKRVGHRGQRDVMVSAGPRTSLEMIEAEFVFEFAVVLFDAPPSFGEAHEAAKAKGESRWRQSIQRSRCWGPRGF